MGKNPDIMCETCLKNVSEVFKMEAAELSVICGILCQKNYYFKRWQ